MAFYSYNRFRIVVVILLVLIFWQISHLIQPKNSEVTAAPQLKLGDNNELEPLENGAYNKHKVEKVAIGVYYEALCPDSRHFFMQHLQPVTISLSEFLNVTLVPYGKASTREKDSEYIFECQHGNVECYANKIHACSIDKLEDFTKTVRFTSCMIDNNDDPDAALDRCGDEMKIQVAEIRACAKGEKGSKLLKSYGDMTNLIDITFIPTVTINGSTKQQGLLLKNFLLAVCQEIAMPLPPPCL